MNYDFSVFSLFTKHGLLLFGRDHSDSYPFTWLWRGWTYLGKPFLSYEFETEFDMYLADCREEAMVTSRAMTFLYPGSNVLAFSQRTHRSTAAYGFYWGVCVPTTKLWKVNTPSETGRLQATSSVPVCGSDVGCVVITCQESHKIQIRDLTTGARLRDISVRTSVDIIWADETKIIALNKNLSTSDAVTIIKM